MTFHLLNYTRSGSEDKTIYRSNLKSRINVKESSQNTSSFRNPKNIVIIENRWPTWHEKPHNVAPKSVDKILNKKKKIVETEQKIKAHYAVRMLVCTSARDPVLTLNPIIINITCASVFLIPVHHHNYPEKCFQRDQYSSCSPRHAKIKLIHRFCIANVIECPHKHFFDNRRMFRF